MLLALTTAQKFSTGSITFVLGISITFVVLAMLVGFVMLMQYFNKIDIKELFHKKKKSHNQLSSTVSQTDEEAVADVIPEQTIAAINAAVKVYMDNSTDTPHERYTIRSIKKITKEDA